MNISEASAVSTVLRAVTGTANLAGGPSEQDIAAALEFLNGRAAKAMQLTRIVEGGQLEQAARELAQRQR